nr:hypothetical protein [Tanacetum cinerariifolium]
MSSGKLERESLPSRFSLKFLILRSCVASMTFNLLLIASVCSIPVPKIKGGFRSANVLTRLPFAIANLWILYGFVFVHSSSDPTKVLIGERNIKNGEVKLLTLTEGRVVLLVPPASAASGGSNDNIDKLFDDGNDEVVVEKSKKSKQKRKVTEDASGSTLPPKKLREDYHAATSNTGEKSLATIRGLISEGSSVSSDGMKPHVVASVTPTPNYEDDGATNSVPGLNLQTRPSSMRSPVTDAPVMTVTVTTTIVVDVFVVLVSKGRVMSENLENFRNSVSAGRG